MTAVVALISLGAGLKVAVSSQFGVSSTEVISVQAGGLNFGSPPGTGVVNPLGDDELKAIYHSKDTVCFYIFKSRDLRNEFIEKTKGMNKIEREEVYKEYSK